MNHKLLGALAVSLCWGSALAQGVDGKTKEAPVAAPFGVVVGTTTCKEAAPILGAELEPESGGFVRVRARGPAHHLAGATKLEGVCRSVEAPVHALALRVEPTDAASVSYMQTLRTLRIRYVETRKPLEPDNGLWEFATGNGKALLFNYRGRSEYDVIYQSSAWVQHLQESEALRKAETQRKNEEREAAKQGQLNKL